MSPTENGRTDPRFARALLDRDDAFVREDEEPDSRFYARPRMVSHLDTTALDTVERLVAGLVPEEDPHILDLMAAVDSHLPSRRTFHQVTGLGMNEEELQANPALTRRVVHDLNADPSLPFSDDVFDVVLNVVSVEYLVRPVEVFREVARVLAHGLPELDGRPLEVTASSQDRTVGVVHLGETELYRVHVDENRQDRGHRQAH